MLVILERDGDARDPEECSFDRGRHRAGVEHVDPGVEPAVDAADDDVRPSRAKLRDPQLHRISRAAVDCPAAAVATREDLLGRQGREKRDRVPHAALLRGGGHDAHVAEPAEGSFERASPGAKMPSSLVSRVSMAKTAHYRTFDRGLSILVGFSAPFRPLPP